MCNGKTKQNKKPGKYRDYMTLDANQCQYLQNQNITIIFWSEWRFMEGRITKLYFPLS